MANNATCTLQPTLRGGDERAAIPHSLSHGALPSQHPVMNQYSQYYQAPRESFYDTPNKFRCVASATACLLPLPLHVPSVTSRFSHWQVGLGAHRPAAARRARSCQSRRQPTAKNLRASVRLVQSNTGWRVACFIIGWHDQCQPATRSTVKDSWPRAHEISS